jgi:hypothetical protein
MKYNTMNNKRYIIALIWSLVCLSNLYGQKISGIVIDEQNQPMEFVNVVLYSLPDSVLIMGTITNEAGEFSFNSNREENTTFLKFSSIGYESLSVSTLSESMQVVLKADALVLGEVVVKGYLPKIQLKNDALVAVVRKSVLSKAGTGNDVLKRLPMLSGDNGKFSVFGKGEAKIFINNREMRDMSELDNLNSANIKDVEIVSNPGARYDASVKAVIRINTIHETGDGFSFDVRSSNYQSQNTDLREQLNINYRKEGWDLFGTFSYNHDEGIQESNLLQKTFVDTLWTQHNTLFVKTKDEILKGVVGINRDISQKHYIGIKYSLSLFPESKWLLETNSRILADDLFYDNWNSNETKNVLNKPAHRVNTYYYGTLGKLKIDFNADFFINKESSESVVVENAQEHQNRVVTSLSDVNNRLIASKLIFTYPTKGGDFSLGTEFTNTDRDDKYRNKENIVSSSNTTIKEQNNSFFAEYAHTFTFGQFNAGLRYENVHTKYNSDGKDINEQSRKSNQFFPGLSFNTRLKNINMQLSYTAKTERPTYRQLSGNVFYMNQLSLQTGNPFLKSSTVHDVTLVGSWRFLQMIISYKNEYNAIIFWTEQMQEDPKISVVSYRNLEKLPSLRTFITASPTFGIWSPQVSAGFIKQWLTIISNNKPITLNKLRPVASLNNSFTLPKGFLLTFDTRFEGKGDYQNVYLSENAFVVNIGLTKSFLDERIRVELKGHDIFKGRKEGNLLYNEQMELYQFNRYDSRKVELTLRYKFNSAKSKYKGSGAGNNEINRF